MANYKLEVNGQLREVDVEPDTPLLWVIRDELQLTGTKFGCGIGQCRSCTVHLDGVATFSCLLPISSVVGKKVTTIEGLAVNGELTVLQQAWIAEDVPQCGYCQSGQIMTATELLAKNANPTDDEIVQWMAPVLCRCGTYPRIKKAIRRAAEELAHKA